VGSFDRVILREICVGTQNQPGAVGGAGEYAGI